jgi:hypothetical protein
MKLSYLLFILGIILIFVGYSTQIKPPCKKEIDLQFINEEKYNHLLKNNASRIYNDLTGDSK